MKWILDLIFADLVKGYMRKWVFEILNSRKVIDLWFKSGWDILETFLP